MFPLSSPTQESVTTANRELQEALAAKDEAIKAGELERARLEAAEVRLVELLPVVEEDEVGFICDAGDPEALGKAILRAAEKRDELKELGERFRRAMRRRYGFKESTLALREWAKAPVFAPDHGLPPTCLQAMVTENEATADGAAEGPDDAHAPAPKNSGEDLRSAPPAGENRLQWLVRVVRKSYQDGGLPMIMRRTMNLGGQNQD